MPTNIQDLILDNLKRIEEKQDQQAAQITAISDRLARLEENVKQYAAIENDVDKLKSEQDKQMGAKAIILGLISIGIAIAGVVFH